MATILGSIDLKDSDRPFVSVSGQKLMYDLTLELFNRLNAEWMAARSLFVQETTRGFKEKYKLPGGGNAEKLAFQETNMGESKTIGEFEVAYPIWVIGDKLSWNRVSRAYLTVGSFEAHLRGVINRFNNTNFRRLLAALFKNTDTTFLDPVHGSLTVKPLANQDGTYYPPPVASNDEAEQNFYVGTSYTESGISNSNDPFKAIRDKIEPIYGYDQGGSRLVVLVNNSAMPYIRLMAGFDPEPAHNLRPGITVDVPASFPPDRFMLPNSRFEGVVDGTWVVSWPRMPSGWMAGFHVDAPPPLKFRTDEVDGLGDGGINLVSQDDSDWPFETARWVQRGGYGVGNRLGAVMVALNGTSSYTIPTGYDNLEA